MLSRLTQSAKVVRARGALGHSQFTEVVMRACRAVKRPDGGVGIPAFGPGQFRHSVATWAIQAGANPAAVAAFLGHRSPQTTRRFYATHAVTEKVPTLA